MHTELGAERVLEDLRIGVVGCHATMKNVHTPLCDAGAKARNMSAPGCHLLCEHTSLRGLRGRHVP